MEDETELSKNTEEKVSEEVNEKPEEKIEEGEENEDEDSQDLPFPNARVVRIIRNEIGSSKQIRSSVKKEANIWLGNLLKKIAREMSDTQYGSVSLADFKRATKPYDQIDEILEEEERLLLSLEKIKADADHVIRDMKGFFESLKENE